MTTPLPRPRASFREHVVATYRGEIEDGTLKAGDDAPVIAEVAERWNISPTTAQRVLARLAQEGWIKTRAGKASVIIGVPPDRDSPPAERAGSCP